MGFETGIGWTDMTHNEWIGCEKVSRACDFCYAEVRDQRFHAGAHWGPGAPRHRTSENNRNNLLRWNRRVGATGKRWVFVSSLSDVFDNAVPPEWRADLFDRIRRCTDLRFQFVTKRIPNVRRMVPPDWETAFGHCGVIISVCDQEEAERDVPRLLRTPAPWRGISYEPALGPVDFRALRVRGPDGRPAVLDALTGLVRDAAGAVVERLPHLDWLIVGGESGAEARAFDPAWAASVVEQGEAAGVPVFVKQMGTRPVGLALAHPKGENPSEWPEALRVRRMPAVYDVGGRLAA